MTLPVQIEATSAPAPEPASASGQQVPVAPAFAELVADGAWSTIDFISDLHLWDQSPRTFEAWAAFMRGSRADAIFILGDLFEVWVGDDARSEPFEAQCVQVLKDAAASKPVFFLHGNRDFMVGPAMLEETHVSLLADPTVLTAFGQRVMLTHGDELCLSDTDYQRFRLMVRNPQWQAQFLAQPLEKRRMMVRQVRMQSEQRKAEGGGMEKWVDLDLPAAVASMEAADAPVMVHGHTHMPGDQELAPGRRRVVMTDWDLDVAEGSTPRAEVLRLTAAGFQRVSVAAAIGSIRPIGSLR